MANPKGNPEFGKTIKGRQPKATPAPVIPLDSTSSVFQKLDAAVDNNLDALIAALLDRAIKTKNQQAIMYLLDRRLGKTVDRSSERDDKLEETFQRLAAALQDAPGGSPDLESAASVL